MESTKTVSEHFVCSADVVWKVLTDASSYKDWFGWPESLELMEVTPGFQLGGKLNFRNSASTLVINKFISNQKMMLTGGYRSDEFTIKNAENGCKVSLVTTFADRIVNENEASLESGNRTILKSLRRVCYAYLTQEQRNIGRPSTSISDILFRVVKGYRRTHERGADDPYTERMLYIPRRNIAVGVLMLCILFSVLHLCFTFERSKVVPSSGMITTESTLVQLENASQIYIGQSKSELELMLSCAGTRISTDTYSYRSIENIDGFIPRYEVVVVYDAYGKVRRYGYVDHLQSDRFGVPVLNVAASISPSMTLPEIQDALSFPVSAFWEDKSGTKTVYFGHYLMEDNLFDANRTSELVLRMSESARKAQVGYYLAEDVANPLRFDVLGAKTKRQYSSLSEYNRDRAMFGRVFLLPGHTRTEVNHLLGGAEEIREELMDDEQVKVTYCFSRTENPYRYEYEVLFRENVAVEVSMVNLHLSQKRDMLLAPEEYGSQVGDNLYNVYADMQILPSRVTILEDGQMFLCYGMYSPPDYYETIANSYPMVYQFSPFRLVTEIFMNNGAI